MDCGRTPAVAEAEDTASQKRAESPVESTQSRRREGVDLRAQESNQSRNNIRRPVVKGALCRDGVAWLIGWPQNPMSGMVWRLARAHRQAAEAEVQSVK